MWTNAENDPEASKAEVFTLTDQTKASGHLLQVGSSLLPLHGQDSGAQVPASHKLPRSVKETPRTRRGQRSDLAIWLYVMKMDSTTVPLGSSLRNRAALKSGAGAGRQYSCSFVAAEPSSPQPALLTAAAAEHRTSSSPFDWQKSSSDGTGTWNQDLIRTAAQVCVATAVKIQLWVALYTGATRRRPPLTQPHLFFLHSNHFMLWWPGGDEQIYVKFRRICKSKLFLGGFLLTIPSILISLCHVISFHSAWGWERHFCELATPKLFKIYKLFHQ